MKHPRPSELNEPIEAVRWPPVLSSLRFSTGIRKLSCLQLSKSRACWPCFRSQLWAGFFQQPIPEQEWLEPGTEIQSRRLNRLADPLPFRIMSSCLQCAGANLCAEPIEGSPAAQEYAIHSDPSSQEARFVRAASRCRAKVEHGLQLKLRRYVHSRAAVGISQRVQVCSTILYHTVIHHTILYHTIPYYTIPHSTQTGPIDIVMVITMCARGSGIQVWALAKSA